ncbi:hypothetical protein [Hwanghaeella sp.]|uniref:hypothetical protein n=1 Tax=Hwanghaeella sp. TaxID=2605943 RepID=UPI003CCBBF2A
MSNCKGVVAAYQNGRPMNRYNRLASEEIVRVSEHVSPDEVMETTLALFIMQEQAGRRFLSDEAFWHQLTRRVRGLTQVNSGTWLDPSSGTRKRVYLDLAPAATVIMGKALAETFGMAGMMLAKKEAEEAEKKQQELKDIAQAVRELK